MILSKKNSTITVVGAGSWGTAIAGTLSSKGHTVFLWGHRREHMEKLKEEGQNSKYLPGFFFGKNLIPTNDLKEAVGESEILCLVVPSQVYRSVFKEILPDLRDNTIIVSAVKGIENKTLLTMTQVMEEELIHNGKKVSVQLAVLSGPSFAREVADNIPTAVTIGCRNMSTARMLQDLFGTDTFRVYVSTDVVGLEVSAAFKNVIAIATGICDGLGYGMNTRAALITRGLAEITRYGMHIGADPQTFSGLSGMGDLILTCTGDLSRNRSVGVQLGRGKKLEQILSEMNMVAEGVKTTLSGYKLSRKHGIEMPILEQVYKILYENKDCSKAVQDLLSRDMKAE